MGEERGGDLLLRRCCCCGGRVVGPGAPLRGRACVLPPTAVANRCARLSVFLPPAASFVHAVYLIVSHPRCPLVPPLARVCPQPPLRPTPSSPPALPPTSAAMASKVAKAPSAKKTHPTYSVMSAEAVKALKERSGSSLPALTKYITTTYSIDVNKHALNKALRDSVSDGKLIKVKASYKLPAAAAKEAPKKKKKAAPAAAAAAAPKVCRSGICRAVFWSDGWARARCARGVVVARCVCSPTP